MEATKTQISYRDKRQFYRELTREVEALADPFWLTALANVSASLKQHLPDVNWVGFYLFRDGELVLGPFQGLPACTRIAPGKGVCGTAARDRQTIVVADVDQFPGHIACDSASRSEIVVPLVLGERLLGVLDVDSPSLHRFDDEDRHGLEAVAKSLLTTNEFPTEF